MPHITIEYSANVAEHHDIDALVGAVHQAALKSEIAGPAGMRIRGAERAHYRVGDGDERFAFIAMYCRLGPGRSLETQQAFIETILDVGEAAVGESPLAIAWSMEVAEINADLRVNRNHVKPVLDARDGT